MDAAWSTVKGRTSKLGAGKMFQASVKHIFSPESSGTIGALFSGGKSRNLDHSSLGVWGSLGTAGESNRRNFAPGLPHPLPQSHQGRIGGMNENCRGSPREHLENARHARGPKRRALHAVKVCGCGGYSFQASSA